MGDLQASGMLIYIQFGILAEWDKGIQGFRKRRSNQSSPTSTVRHVEPLVGIYRLNP